MTNPSGALWNWHLHGLVAATEIRAALVEILTRPVLPLGPGDLRLPDEPVLCDVWYTDGDFPTGVDCYLAPTDPAEAAVAAALATRVGHHLLLPDDTLDPGRFLLAAPDGTLRPVHVDVEEGEDGPILCRPRPCTMSDLRGATICRQSRWAPDSVVPGSAAA
ncbi:MAG TPA: hypothetical protein VF174_01435 [Micromonosporaceae bacterium]